LGSLQPARKRRIFRFGDEFELDTIVYELRCRSVRLKLKPIPMEILLLLLERQGELVTREEIAEHIWGEQSFVDTDNSINGAISKIRQVLRDNAEQARYLETVTGKGYRFICKVQVEEPPVSVDRLERAPGEAPAPSLGGVAPDQLVPATRIRSLWPVLVVAAILLSAAARAYVRWFGAPIQTTPRNDRIMLAVLPFENFTGDPSQDYLSDGLTEEMITQLGRLDPEHLAVIARTSVMHYKHSTKPLGQIAAELRVQYVLEGSVRRDGDRVRVSAQFIQVADQTNVWTRQYDRAASGFLALQGEIAQEIAGEVEPALGRRRTLAVRPEHSQPNQNYEAYDLYLRGLYFLNKRTVQGLTQSGDYFLEATRRDPNDARAYAGLAAAYALTSGYSAIPPRELMEKARAAAEHALELDEGLAEAHTARAWIAQTYEWNWPLAEKEYQRAIQLNPNYATAHHWYGEFLALQGRFEQSFQEIDRAQQLDPLSLIISSDKAVFLYFSRNYDRATEEFSNVLEMDPSFPRAQMVVYTYVQTGQYDEALARLQVWKTTQPTPWRWGMLAYIYGRSGKTAKAREALNELERLNQQMEMDPLPLAMGYLGIGDKDAVFHWLDKAYQLRSGGLNAIKVDPSYDLLRGDPRYRAFLQRMGFTS
jgi:TolB-like protein/DNA-binding winged helix-turn-helix (wHTH) protein/Flp pilus assembly protein TadD